MSVISLHSDISRLENQIADINNKIAKLMREQSRTVSDITSAEKSLRSTKSSSTTRNGLSKIESLRKKQSSQINDMAKLQKDLAYKQVELSRKKSSLVTEQSKLDKRVHADRDKLQKQQEKKISSMERTIKTQNQRIKDMTISATENTNLSNHNEDKRYDFFISYASEDGDEFVKPLADALVKEGFEVWFDAFCHKPGDSLRRSIDKGLRSSNRGLVVLSKHYIAKEWPQKEFDALFSLEGTDGESLIIPLWHEISKNEVQRFSPMVADKKAILTAVNTIDEIVEMLKVFKR